jgi:hypothetical protein
MPGLAPGIHVFDTTCKKDVDGRDKPGHDENDRFSANFPRYTPLVYHPRLR